MAYSLIASVAAGASGGGAVTTGAIDTTGATLLVLSVGWYYPLGTPTISDSKSNMGWTPLTTQANITDNGNLLYYVENPTVGSGHTFTNSVGDYSSLAVAAFGGALTASVFDQQNGAIVSPGTSLATGSVTPSENNELVIAGLCLRDIGSAGDTASINGGFSIAAQQTGSGGNHLEAAIAYLIQTTATAANPTWSWTTSDLAAATIATFKAASAPTGNPWYAYAQQYSRPRLPTWLRSAGGILMPEPAFG